MSDCTAGPIGGYFELELPEKRDLPYAGVIKFQSSRAAFLALLRAGKPKKVWVPRYICNAMLSPLEVAGIEYCWYDVNDRLEVNSEVKLDSGDWLVYVNYFGLCEKNVTELLQRYPSDQVVLDYAQSFFAPPSEIALATIYSPRKFFGIPDGGLLYSRIPVSTPECRDSGSLARSKHLLRRLADPPESGYQAYQQAEESLSISEPKRMSLLTERIFTSIDFAIVSKKRKENFHILHQRLGSINQFQIEMSQPTTPLCYPFMTQDVELRARLISNRIFIATYWQDSINRLDSQWADSMIRNLLPLPIDQRYGCSDMERLASIILENK